MNIPRSISKINSSKSFFNTNDSGPYDHYAIICFFSGSLLLLFTVSLFIFSSIGFSLKHGITPHIFYLSILTITLLWSCVGIKYFEKNIVDYVFIVIIGTFLISSLSSIFFDVSYDGQVYHQETIIQLIKGWNPFYEALIPTNEAEKEIFVWAKNYAKAPEIAQSCIYKVVNRIEPAKSLNFILLFASFYLTVCCLLSLKMMSLKNSLLLGAAAALNPVVVCQLLTFYIDGQLGAVALCLLCLLYLFYSRPTIYLSFIIVATSVYFINIKFTGVIYFAVLSAGFLIVCLINKKIKLFKAAFILLTSSFLLGIFVFGYNPYVSNFKEHGHPFYPLMGSGKVDIMEKNRSSGFNSLTSVQRLGISLLARSTTYTEADVKLKIPLTVSKREIAQFEYPDVRLGGFGQLFSGILLLSLALLVLSFARSKMNLSFYVVLLFLIISVVINPECWWARYVPQLWLMPLLLMIFLDHEGGGALAKRLITVMALLIFLNIALISSYHLMRQTLNTLKVRRELTGLAHRKMPIHVDFCGFRSNRIRFDERGITYAETSGLSSDFTKLHSTMTKVQNDR